MAQTKNWRRSIVGVLAKLLRRMDAADLPGMDTASRAAGLTLSVAQTRLDHLLDLPGPTGQFQTTDVAEATDLFVPSDMSGGDGDLLLSSTSDEGLSLGTSQGQRVCQ
jgi:hypothetical protein